MTFPGGPTYPRAGILHRVGKDEMQLLQLQLLSSF